MDILLHGLGLAAGGTCLHRVNSTCKEFSDIIRLIRSLGKKTSSFRSCFSLRFVLGVSYAILVIAGGPHNISNRSGCYSVMVLRSWECKDHDYHGGTDDYHGHIGLF